MTSELLILELTENSDRGGNQSLFLKLYERSELLLFLRFTEKRSFLKSELLRPLGTLGPLGPQEPIIKVNQS